MMPSDEITLRLSAAKVNMVLALLDSAVRALITEIMTQAAEQEAVPNVSNAPNAGDGVAEPKRRAAAAT